MYDIYIYTYIYQTRLTAFKLLRPMSSAPARGSELLESVEDLKEEEVEDGKTHSHMGIELHSHLGELRRVVERKLLSSQPSSIWTALICWPWSRPDSRKL